LNPREQVGAEQQLKFSKSSLYGRFRATLDNGLGTVITAQN